MRILRYALMPLAFGLALIMIWLASRPGPAPDGPIASPVSEAQAIDGDTLQIGGQIVHLFGIIAPELGQRCMHDNVWSRCGQDAAYELNKMIGVSQVPLRCTIVDNNEPSPAATCMAGQTDVAHALLTGGYVAAAADASPQYREAEAEASRAGLGIWHSQFVNPADWRAGKRLPGSENADMDPCPIKATVTAQGDRLFLVPTDAGYQSVVTDPARGERLFCTVEAARAAGWHHPGEIRDRNN